MMRLPLFVFLLLGLSGVGGYALAQQQVPERAEAPVYKDGDWWQFKVSNRDYITSSTARLGEGTYKLLRDGKSFKMSDSDGNVVTGRIDLTGTLAIMTGSSRRFLDFPLFVGKKWNFEYETSRISSGGGAESGGYRNRLVAEVRVAGVEKIAVPAGGFQAFKIERDDVGAPWHWKWVYHYSPETKSIVKFFLDSFPEGRSGKTEIELLKFGSAAPGPPKGD